jgi:hypothetical protein
VFSTAKTCELVREAVAVVTRELMKVETTDEIGGARR